MKLLDKLSMPKKAMIEEEIDIDLEGLTPEMEGKAKEMAREPGKFKEVVNKGYGASDDSELEQVMGLADFSDDELLNEAKKRGIIPHMEKMQGMSEGEEMEEESEGME